MKNNLFNPVGFLSPVSNPAGGSRPMRGQGGASLEAFPTTSSGLDATLGGYGTSWNYIFDFEEASGGLTDRIASLAATNESGGTKRYRRPGSIDGKHMIQVGNKLGGDTINGFIASPTDVIGTQGHVFIGSFRCCNNIATAAGIGTYGVSGDANHAGILFYLASTTQLAMYFYNTSGFTGSIAVTGTWNDGNIHDFMVVRDYGVGVYLFTDQGSASSTTDNYRNANLTHAQRWSFGRPSTWFSAGAQRGTAWQYAAMSVGDETAELCRLNGADMISNFRAQRTVARKRVFPVQSADVKELIGNVGSDAWKHITRFQETSGNLTTEDSLEVATATGVAGDDVITYSRASPVAGHSAIALRDTGAGDGTASRFVFDNAVIQPDTGSLATLAVFKVAATAAANRTLYGMESGGAFDQVQSGGTTGILRHQVFDGTLSNATVGGVDSDDQWIVALAIFDNPNNAIYLTTNLEDISATGVSLGTVANAGKGFALGSSAGHKSLDFAFFAATNDITDLVANRTAIVDAVATALGL